MRLFFFLLSLIVLFAGCSKDDDVPTLSNFREVDSLIFGWYYGECLGESCVETFRLTENALYEDVNDPYAGSSAFKFTDRKTDEIFEQAQILTDDFPTQLLREPDQTFGCPDCADQGGMFIQVSTSSGNQTWRLDQGKTDVPKYLHEYMGKVNSIIQSTQ